MLWIILKLESMGLVSKCYKWFYPLLDYVSNSRVDIKHSLLSTYNTNDVIRLHGIT